MLSKWSNKIMFIFIKAQCYFLQWLNAYYSSKKLRSHLFSLILNWSTSLHYCCSHSNYYLATTLTEGVKTWNENAGKDDKIEHFRYTDENARFWQQRLWRSTHIICYWQECLTIQDTLPAWNWWTPGQTWRTGRCRVSGTWSSWPF